MSVLSHRWRLLLLVGLAAGTLWLATQRTQCPPARHTSAADLPLVASTSSPPLPAHRGIGITLTAFPASPGQPFPWGQRQPEVLPDESVLELPTLKLSPPMTDEPPSAGLDQTAPRYPQSIAETFPAVNPPPRFEAASQQRPEIRPGALGLEQRPDEPFVENPLDPQPEVPAVSDTEAALDFGAPPDVNLTREMGLTLDGDVTPDVDLTPDVDFPPEPDSERGLGPAFQAEREPEIGPAREFDAEPRVDRAPRVEWERGVDVPLPLTIDEASRQLEAALRGEAARGEQPPRPGDPQPLATIGPPPGLLPTRPDTPARRSRQLELIAREADMHTRRGFELAGLKAYYSARAEFVKALRLVSQALDAEHQTTTHSRALAAGWTAIREADDFAPTGSRLEADLNLPSLIRAHRTPVLKDAPVETLAPLAGLRSYLTFAQEQLAAAVGEELAGSMALHGLGKLHWSLAARQRGAGPVATSKAIVFYQAALLATPRNYMASNELGVLLARGGRYEEARSALEYTVSVKRQAVALYNLAVVYHELGRTELARQAYRHCQAIYEAQTKQRGQRSGPPDRQVEWVDPGTFARWHGGPRSVAPAASPDTLSLDTLSIDGRRLDGPGRIVLCQALGPAAPCSPCAVDCSCCDWSRRDGWERARAIAWQAYAQGEYVGHARTAHVPEYRLRVDDLLDLVYRVTRNETATPYRLNVGDELRVESSTDKELNRELVIQPDGSVTLPFLGQVQATGRTVPQLRDDLEGLYKKYYPIPAITVTPLKVNTKLEDLRAVVDSRYGRGGQGREARVTPEGTIALPVIGSVQAQGLTLPELQQELNECYREEIEGIEVIPVLIQRAPRYVYVLGEVGTPGRFELTGPTTVLQALSMAGSWNVGAHLRQIVIFRRGDDWRLMATMVDLRAALHGRKACPAGELWLSDSDVIIVPKSPILRADDFIDLVFTRGIYGVFPVQGAVNFSKLSTL